MNRRSLAIAVAVLSATGLSAALPADAAKKKPITGHYDLQLPPDPVADVVFQAGAADPVDGFCGPSAASQDRHEITIPARGRLEVRLNSTNPLPAAPPYGMDWDLYVLDADDAEISSSTSPTAQEQTADKLKKKQTVTVLVCNLNGAPDATVDYTFTYA